MILFSSLAQNFLHPVITRMDSFSLLSDIASRSLCNFQHFIFLTIFFLNLLWTSQIKNTLPLYFFVNTVDIKPCEFIVAQFSILESAFKTVVFLCNPAILTTLQSFPWLFLIFSAVIHSRYILYCIISQYLHFDPFLFHLFPHALYKT